MKISYRNRQLSPRERVVVSSLRRIILLHSCCTNVWSKKVQGRHLKEKRRGHLPTLPSPVPEACLSPTGRSSLRASWLLQRRVCAPALRPWMVARGVDVLRRRVPRARCLWNGPRMRSLSNNSAHLRGYREMQGQGNLRLERRAHRLLQLLLLRESPNLVGPQEGGSRRKAKRGLLLLKITTSRCLPP